MTVALVTVWNSIREVKDPFEFDMEHGIFLQTMQENPASSCVVRKHSVFTSSFGSNLRYILQSEWG